MSALHAIQKDRGCTVGQGCEGSACTCKRMVRLVLEGVRETPGLLFHGTSLDRAAKIIRDGVIRVAPSGHRTVSMTHDLRVAIYFAVLAADADEGTPCVLPIDAEALRRDGFELEPFSDEIYGPGECDWEAETVSWRDIPTKYVTANLGSPQ